MLVAVPLQTDLYTYLALEFGIGIFDAGLEVSCNTWMLEMWQEAASPYMLGMYFVTSLGRSLALFSISPFLSDPHNHIPSNLRVPYTTIAIILCSVAIIVFATYWTRPYVQPQRNESGDERQISTLEACLARDENNNEATSSRSKWKHRLIVTMGCLIMCFGVNVKNLISFFLPSFIIDIGLGNEKGSVLAGVFQASYSVSRLVGAFIALRVPVKIMLLACFVLLVGGNVSLLIFAHSSEPMVWTAILILGMGMSCVEAGTYCMLEQMIDVTNIISGSLVFSGSMASVIMTIVLEFTMEQYPFLFVYMNIFSIVVCLLTLFAFYFIDR